MGRLFDLVEAHRDSLRPYEPSYARIADQVGVARQTLLNWRTPTKLIDLQYLVRLSEVTGVPYHRVLDALLDDIGYLNPDLENLPKASRRGRSAGRRLRDRQDEENENRQGDGPTG